MLLDILECFLVGLLVIFIGGLIIAPFILLIFTSGVVQIIALVLVIIEFIIFLGGLFVD